MTRDDLRSEEIDRRASDGASLLGTARRAFEGPNTIGNSRRFWVAFGSVVAFLLVYPLLTNPHVVITNSKFFIWMILALSLAVVWGYTGIFNFGQTAFFGLGGYAFGIVAINLAGVTGGTNLALLAAVVAPVVASALIGYFMFYGRVSGLYVAILTLAVALTGNLFLTRTTGEQIGAAALGGANGMTGIPDHTLGVGSLAVEFGPTAEYYFVVVTLIVVYLGLRYALNSYYGYVMVAIREDEERTEMFGYDVRRMKLLVFTAMAGLGGFAGGLYAGLDNFIDPTIMGLTLASLPIVWVTVGGRDTLVGAALGAYVLQSISNQLSTVGSGYTVIFLGVVLVVVVLFFPEGIVPATMALWRKRRGPDAEQPEEVDKA